jgi:hypothetical protein
MESRAPQCRADIEVTCFTYEGIDAIRDALLTGCDAGTAECPIRIKLIAPPMYVMTTMTLDKDLGIAALQAGIDAITAKIQVRAGAVARVVLAAALFSGGGCEQRLPPDHQLTPLKCARCDLTGSCNELVGWFVRLERATRVAMRVAIYACTRESARAA